MYIHIHKSSKNIVYIQLFFVCVMLWLQSVLKFPSFINYLTDLFLVYMAIKCVGKFQRRIILANAVPICVVIALLFISTIVGLIYNEGSILMYLWGLRNHGRFYLFFLCCVVLLEQIDIEKILKMLCVFFWVNFFIVVFQYVFQEVQGDFAGGIFGNEHGCNGYLNVFLCVVSAYIIARYLTNHMGVVGIISYISSAVIVAVIAELKVFYVEILIMLVIAIVANNPSLKTMGIVLVGIVVICFGISLLEQYNPKSLETLVDADVRNFYLSGEGYTSAGDLNRYTAIIIIGQKFFKGNFAHLLFGYGLGSCDTSNFGFLQSDFYNKYGDLHYRWFSHAWIYLEQGWIGLILCILFFASIMIWMFMKKKIFLKKDLWLTTFIFVPTCLLGLIYNSALQMEICFMIAFMCAIPFIVNKKLCDPNNQ